MAPWRALAAAAVAATIAAAVAATPATTAAGAAPAAVAAPATTPAGVDAALPTAGRQCTQAGDFPTHDGCSATVPSVVVPLHRLAGRWVMWDLSYDAVTYVKGLFGLGPAAQITCPTMDNTLRSGGGGGGLAVKLCLTTRREGGSARTVCRRWTVTYTGAGGRRRALLWRPAGGGGRRPPLPPIKNPRRQGVGRRPRQCIHHLPVPGGPRAAAAAVRPKGPPRGHGHVVPHDAPPRDDRVSGGGQVGARH
eukprot:TRINITY_DN1596_c0_g1_i3.p1 TRINITY_DN1596_c0_g1~~TRINITY_DN1596_c0_g1_i3.p1  ORF type:complete len:250 (-),score=57.38 TRINITY_DN1596_c0_g1_i3:192-941(-)